MRSSGLHHFVAAAMAVSYGLLIGCSTLSRPDRLSSEQANSLSKIKSITLMAPEVSVVRQEVAPGPSVYERSVSEWTEKARRNIVQAAVKQFGELFVLKESAAGESAEAFLSVSASDEIKTSSRRAMDTLGLAYGTFLLPVLYTTLMPMLFVINPNGDINEFNRGMLKVIWPAGLTTIKLELKDPHSGEVLWSFVKESRSGYDLRDYASVESLIAEAVEDLKAKMPLTNISD